MKFWNIRYLAYCYPRKPEEQLELDDELYRGGKMIGFMLWIGARWREFDALNGRRAGDCDARTDQRMREFDAWLLSREGLVSWPGDDAGSDIFAASRHS